MLFWFLIDTVLQRLVYALCISNIDGFYPITLECFVNGHLSVLRRAQFGSLGKSPLYVGGSPSNIHHYYGRIYSVMV